MPRELRGVLDDEKLVGHDVRDIVHALQLAQVIALRGATDEVAHLHTANRAAAAATSRMP
jgi:hypothetical protein